VAAIATQTAQLKLVKATLATVETHCRKNSEEERKGGRGRISYTQIAFCLVNQKYETSNCISSLSSRAGEIKLICTNSLV
jgi:hypothetical protein